MTDSEKLDLLLSEVQELKQEVVGVKNETKELKQEVTDIKNETKELKQEVTDIKNETKELKQKVECIENKLTDINLTLENEIRVNIQRVAEGHLDLSRHLHEALRLDNEKEMLAVRVSVLETDMRRIKTHLDIA